MRREHRDDDLSNAGVQRADAVVVLGLDEMTTVRVALTVEEMNPSARIVLELDNPAFGRRLEPLLGSCTALSAAELPSMRALGIPVLIVEASDDEILRKTGVERAECLVTVTDSDAANLQVSLAAKAVNPGLRVVTSMFDDDLGGRVESQLDTGPTRLVSRLAAPAFAAAALGRSPETVVPVGRRSSSWPSSRLGGACPWEPSTSPGRCESSRTIATAAGPGIHGVRSCCSRVTWWLWPQPGRAWRRPAEPWGSDATSPGGYPPGAR